MYAMYVSKKLECCLSAQIQWKFESFLVFFGHFCIFRTWEALKLSVSKVHRRLSTWNVAIVHNNLSAISCTGGVYWIILRFYISLHFSLFYLASCKMWKETHLFHFSISLLNSCCDSTLVMWRYLSNCLRLLTCLASQAEHCLKPDARLMTRIWCEHHHCFSRRPAIWLKKVQLVMLPADNDLISLMSLQS